MTPDTPSLFETPATPRGFALVAPERGLDAHGGALTYAVPATMRDLAVGHRVVVPLGRGDRGVTGYVIELMDRCALARVKPIKERDPHGVTITPDLIALARWMAGYYCCPLGMVLATMLPAAVKHGTGSVRQWLVRLPEQEGRDASNATPAPAPPSALPVAADAPLTPRPGALSSEGGGSKKKRARLSPQQTAVLEQARLAQEAGEAWIEIKRLADRAGARTVQPVKQLIDKGVLLSKRQSVVIPAEDRARRYQEAPRAINLNADQAAAIEAISRAAGQGFSVHLIHGVTGSGKTEVYLRVLEKVLGGKGPAEGSDQRIANSEQGKRSDERAAISDQERSRHQPSESHQPSAISHQPEQEKAKTSDLRHATSDIAAPPSEIRDQRSEIRDSSSPGAIILVPEISLTPQTVGRFMARFESVAVLHSGMTESQRHHQWRRIRSGQARVVIGARSAVFAPLPSVGLIIVDEEHDNAYKQDQLPRYHARDVAIKRGQLLGVPVVLGSATPSLESFFNAGGGEGSYQLSAISYQPEKEQAKASGIRHQASGIAATSSEISDQRSAISDSSPSRPRPRMNYHLHRLPQRVGNLRLPRVEIVDLTLERRKRYEMTGSAGVHLLSLRLEAELRRLFGGRSGEPRVANSEQRTANSERGTKSHQLTDSHQPSAISHQPEAEQTKTSDIRHQTSSIASTPSEISDQRSAISDSSSRPQALLLLNRRGYANYISCPDHRCGWMMPCEFCDVTMVYHKDAALPLGGLVKCHHCTAEQLLPTNCPTCKRKITVFGLGTQRVEEELQRKFPGARVRRMDSDAMRTGRDYHDTLEAFRNGEIDILVGTQMIAKGLDFPNVRLVGVISADTALHLPDFRASERTFQLVAQVAGRTGRGDDPGLVIVQTFSPSDRAIELAARHDYDTFARQELALRAQVGLPPLTRMARIVVRDKDLLTCTRHAVKLADALHAANPPPAAAGHVRVRGPAPCSIARVGGFHRQQVELLALDAMSLQRLMTALRNARLLISDARTAVDVDPVVLM